MDELDEAEIEAFRRRLLELREETLAMRGRAASSARPVELDQTRVGRLSRMDAIQGQAMQIAAQNRREQTLARIEAALARIDAGDYGWCAGCGEAIARGRLDLDPTTPSCVDCARKAG